MTIPRAHRPESHHGHMLSDRIKASRIAAGLSQSALARRCKCHPSAINKLEKGDTKSLSGELLIAIATELSVSSVWLETGKGSPNRRQEVSIDESEMLIIFRLLTEANQQAVLSVGRTLLSTQTDTPKVIQPFQKLPVKSAQ